LLKGADCDYLAAMATFTSGGLTLAYDDIAPSPDDGGATAGTIVLVHGFAMNREENWRRLWQLNPALAVAKSQLSMGWVLETAQGIVGYQGNVPLLYQFGGRTLVAATAAGLVVEPAYRARCIVLLTSFYRQRDVDLFVTTHTTASAASREDGRRSRPA
jgi:hypothetical protein